MNKNNNSNIFLNGPLNYIELYSDKTNQKLHLFMDYHRNITIQKKCNAYEAKDVDKYLYKILSESSEIIDFFLEINPTDVNNEKKYYSNDNYIKETRKIFRKLYKEQKTNKEQHINQSQNIRLHYIDIRDYSFYNEILLISYNLINEVEQYKLSNINFIINELKYVSSTLIFINSCINKINKNENLNLNIDSMDIINFKITQKSNNTDGVVTQLHQKQDIAFQYLLLKILTKYNNEDNKKIIIDFFNNNYLILSQEAINIINDLVIKLEEINKTFEFDVQNDKLNIDKIIINDKKNIVHFTSYYGKNEVEYFKYSTSILDELFKLDLLLLNLGSVFMDSFFLRRLIEKKNYVKKSIIYTGGYHTLVYIWFLIKFCDFKITDYYYVNINKLGLYDNEYDIDDVNIKIKNIINKSQNVNELFEIFMPQKFNQCVKIKNIN